MTDAFISYSRRDSDYVRGLAASLTEAGKEVWVDTEGIRDAERFPDALTRAIEGSDAFLFVISPDSVRSPYCAQEIELAAGLNKRIVPLALHQVPDEEIPDEVRYRNWIPVSPEANDSGRIVSAMETDLDWERQHTRLTVKAREWDGSDRDRSFLLRGSDLSGAEQWMAAGAGRDPGPTELEQQYILAGRRAAGRRQRGLAGASLAVAIVALGLLVFALISRADAVHAKTSAQSQALAAESQVQQAVDPQRAILLGMAAVRRRATYGPNGSMFALESALGASTLRRGLPSEGDQNCTPEDSEVGQEQILSGPGLAVAPGGEQIAEGLCDGAIRVINGRTGRLERTVHVVGSAIQLAYTADGSILAVSTGVDSLVAINARTGRVLRRTIDIAIASPLVAVPGQSLVVGYGQVAVGGGDSSEGVVVWNPRTGASRELDPDRGRAPITDGVAVAPGAHQVALASVQSLVGGSAPGLVLLDTRTGRRLASFAPPVSTVAYAPGGRVLAVGLDPASGAAGVAILNPHDLSLERRLVAPSGAYVTALSFSANGRWLAYGTSNGDGAVLNARTGTPLFRILGPTGLMSGIGFVGDSHSVWTTDADGSLQEWNAADAAQFASPVGEPLIPQIVSAPGGYLTLAEDPGVIAQLWSNAGRHRGAPLRLSPTDAVNAAFLSTDGKFAAVIPTTASGGGDMQVWNVAERHLVSSVPIDLPGGLEPTLSPGDRFAVMADPDNGSGLGTLDLQKVTSAVAFPRVLANTTCSAYAAYGFDANGHEVAAASSCGGISVFSTRTGRRLSFFNAGGQTLSMAISADGREIAVGLKDGEITVHDALTGHLLANLGENTAGVEGLAFSPDGLYLASAGSDDTVRIFDGRNLAELRVIPQPTAGVSVAFSASSRSVYSLDADDVVRGWSVCSACENPRALLKLAQRSAPGSLTPQERAEFGTG